MGHGGWRRQTVLAVLSLVLANATVGVGAYVLLERGRLRYEDQARVSARNLVALLDEDLSQLFASVDLTLLAIGDRLTADGIAHPAAIAGGINALLEVQRHRLADDARFRVLTPDGNAVFQSPLDPRPLTFGDHDFFQQLRGRPSGDLIITDPWIDPADGVWVVAMIRPLLSADGRLAGAIMASIPVDALRARLAGIDVGPKGIALIRDRETRLIARHPQVDAPNARIGDKGYSAELGRIIASGVPMADFHAARTADGADRIGGYRRMTAAPFHLVVALSSDEVLATWRRQRQSTVIGALLFLVATAGLTAMLLRAMSRTQSMSEYWRMLLRNSSDGIHILDSRGNIVDASDSFYEMLGYDPGELIGANVATWDVHLDEVTVAQSLAQIEGSNERRIFETVHRRKDGGLIDVEISSRAMTYLGRPVILTSSRDITARKSTQRELEVSERRFREFFEQNSSVMLLVDPAAGLIVDANDSAARFYGHARAAMAGLPIDAIRAEGGMRDPGQPSADGAAMPPPSLGTLHRTAGGQTRHVEIHSTPTEVSGHPLLFCIILDVTEKLRSEEQLKLAANVFTHAREGIAITDTRARIIDANETFERITGYARDEVIGARIGMLKSGRHGPDFYATLWGDLARAGTWSGEIWNRRKSGELYAVLLTISAVRDGAGVVTHYVGLFTDITHIKEHQRQLERNAHFDALTGLPNRVLLADRLKQASLQCERRGQSIAVAFIDLDGFKAVNDTHGHEVGDDLLVGVANAMRMALREGDTIARVGGDEFVAILIDLETPKACAPIIDRLLSAAATPITSGDHVVKVSASIGITFFPQDRVDPEQLLHHADQAMYQAKQTGRNRSHFFDMSRDVVPSERHQSIDDIRRGLESGQFALFYQPRVNLRTGDVIGFEALIRWHHPQHGLLLPGAFLPLIDSHPLSVAIGDWVIAETLRQMIAWRTDGLDARVSVNVSAIEFHQADFVAKVAGLLKRCPAPMAGNLELEVLETSDLGDLSEIATVMRACNDLGIGFALDDFGTGYSSLTYLRRLPVDYVKIDQSFVSNMLEDSDDLAIVEGVVGLARAFSRTLIAEGVETIEQARALLALGCDLAQGFGIARPMPADQVPGWINAWRADREWLALRQFVDGGLGPRLMMTEIKHRHWCRDVENFLSGDRRTSPTLDPDLCDLGLFLSQDPGALPFDPAVLEDLRRAHGAVHHLGARLIDAHLAGRPSEISALLDQLRREDVALMAMFNALAQDNRIDPVAAAPWRA